MKRGDTEKPPRATTVTIMSKHHEPLWDQFKLSPDRFTSVSNFVIWASDLRILSLGLLCFLLDFFCVASEREQDQIVTIRKRARPVWFAMLCFCVDVGGEGRKEKKGFFDGMKWRTVKKEKKKRTWMRG